MQADIEGIKQRDVMQSNKEVYLSQLQCAWQTAFGDMEQPQVSEQSWMNGNTVTFPQEVSLATMQEMAASQRDQSADKKARDETKEHSKKHKKYKVLTPEYLFV
jgi:L-2-hydroxyglutarate oxidase LhgO